jgi:hypothetical protein
MRWMGYVRVAYMEEMRNACRIELENLREKTTSKN